MVNATTGAADTGATVTVYVTKDASAQATGTGTTTNKGQGQYNYAPTQAETNANDVGFVFTATGDVPVFYDFHTDITTAAGYGGIDWASVNAPTTTNNLTNTSVAAVNGSIGGSLVGNILGNVNGSVGSVLAGGLIDLTVTTYAEPTTVVGATATLKDMINWLKLLSRNLITQTATTETVFKDDGTTVVSTSTDSDNGTTFSRGKWS